MFTNKVFSYGRQCIEDDDIRAVVTVLHSDWLTQGPIVAQFENALRNKFQSKFASVVANGTAGLHLVGLALGWKAGDIVLTTPITFLASANCILYAGATPDFVDIDPITYTLDVNKLEEKIKFYRSKNKSIKAVVAVDYAGYPCAWNELRGLADKFNFQLVNDNCHALGAKYYNDIGYASKYADVVNISFHPVKHITTGEGGAILTNNADLDKTIKVLRTHGIIKEESMLERNDGPWYYEMHLLGFNYRITDFQCALGLSQLQKLDRFLAIRRNIAQYYDLHISDSERFIIPNVGENVIHAYHLYPLQIKFEKLSTSKKELFAILREKHINCQVHYIPIHLQPFYRERFGFREGDFPIAEQFYRREISIPMYPGLNPIDYEYISNTIIEVTK